MNPPMMPPEEGRDCVLHILAPDLQHGRKWLVKIHLIAGNILLRPQRHLNLWRWASGKQHCYFISHAQSGVGTYKFACGGDLYRLVKLGQNSLLHFTLSETCWWIWFALGDLDQTGLFLCHPSMCTPSGMTWTVPEPLEHIDSYSDSERTHAQIQKPCASAAFSEWGVFMKLEFP